MYNFYDNFMVKTFNTKLLLTVKDSLCYEIHGKNIQNNIQIQRIT